MPRHSSILVATDQYLNTKVKRGKLVQRLFCLPLGLVILQKMTGKLKMLITKKELLAGTPLVTEILTQSAAI